MTTAVNGTKIGRMVGASLAPFDQVVSRVGARQAAQVADASVAGDDRCRQFSPRLSSVNAVLRVASHALGGSPTERTMKWRFPGHIPSSPLPSLWIRHAGVTASEAFCLLG